MAKQTPKDKKGGGGKAPAAASNKDKPATAAATPKEEKGGVVSTLKHMAEDATKVVTQVVKVAAAAVGITGSADAAAAAKAPAARPATPTAPVKAHSFRRKLVGRVTSNKMNKTVVVEVRRSSRDRVYKKYVQSRAKYKAHDENNEYKVGDRVEIQEHRPISREKRWKVVRLVARPVLE